MRNVLASMMLIIAAISILQVISGWILGGGLDQDVYGERMADWLSSRSP